MPYRPWLSVLSDERYSHSSGMLREYLKLAEGLESPVPFHIWSFLSLMGALAGSRVYIDHGAIGRRKLNLGIVLMGFPAIRKSTAIDLMREFSRGLPLQYGPDDTGGQRQGIMTAMLPRWQYDYMDAKEEWDVDSSSIEALASLDTSAILAELPSPRIPPASELYFAANELGRLLASPSWELLDFFADAMDGNPIYYQLKTQAVRIPRPLVNLVGATTPGSLNRILPRGATEHGLLSRLIFVYADRLSGKNPNPPRWNDGQLALRESMLARLEQTFQEVDGALGLSPNAELTYKAIYDYKPEIQDVRFQAHIGRRSVHVLKVAALLCLTRGAVAQIITSSDIRLAHALMTMTEALMPRSFLGLDPRPVNKIQMGVYEYLEAQPDFTAPNGRVKSQLMHLGNSEEIEKALSLLHSDGRIVERPGTISLNEAQVQMGWTRPTLQFQGANSLDDYAPVKR